MRVVIFILLTLVSFVAGAQDLTGIWRGHFKSTNKLYDSLGIDDRYKFETQIEQNSKSFSGVTYSYRSTVFYGKAACYGAINTKTQKVLLEENKLLEVQSQGGGACLMTLFLQYSKVGNEEFLEGTYTAMDVKDSTSCPGGTVFLRKVPNSDFYKEPFLAEKEKKSPPIAKTNPAPIQKPSVVPKTNTPAAPKKQVTASSKPATPKQSTKPVATKPVTKPKPKPPAIIPSPKKNETLKQLTTNDSIKRISPKTDVGVPVPRVIETRVNELVKTITTSAKDVYIKIYDNGTIDNDTVSVYIDNKLVISRQRLTDKAITVKINLDEKVTFHELVMVADNLGEIPPNTSLMIVNAGDQQYEVRITSTEQKNAVVHFRKE
ncbi:MAG TPA: hypothetical protein VFD56_12185 [Chitinophagaceae bacterium]|nr:hypothetical protein [Chitinophagaceae bacterium]